MQQFFLSGLIFLGLCGISYSSPLLIKKAALHDQQFPGIKDLPMNSFQNELLHPGAIRPVTKVIQEDQNRKAILILETRNNRITVYSGDKYLLYTVSTLGRTVLAEGLKGSELKDRFPELYDIVTGTAWAGKMHTP